MAATACAFSTSNRVRHQPNPVFRAFSAPPAAAHEHWVTVRVEGEPLEWVDRTSASLPALLALPANWDGYGAARVSQQAIANALGVLSQVMRPSSPAPSVVPLADGGVQLEWHMGGTHLEIEIGSGNGDAFDFYQDDGSEEEGALPQDMERLKTIIESLR